MDQIANIAIGGFFIVAAIIFFLLVVEVNKFKKGKKKIEEESKNVPFYPKKDFGAVTTLEILPLCEWYTSGNNLQGAAGVSYLIRTDKGNILFDVGVNGSSKKDLSPLLYNMKQLGVTVNDFDSIVISHNHMDHVGGSKWMMRKTFSLGNEQIDLSSKAVYTPIPMTYPALNPVCCNEPTVIATGIATIGTIQNWAFIEGRLLEQALAIKIAGKGIVLIVGCGHQTVSKILERTESLFAEPLYGIIGGLHYPVADSRVKVMGIELQKYLGTCRLPWVKITKNEVMENIECLKKYDPNVVALSAHDSCDVSIDMFRKAFPDAYREVRVGENINF